MKETTYAKFIKRRKTVIKWKLIAKKEPNPAPIVQILKSVCAAMVALCLIPADSESMTRADCLYIDSHPIINAFNQSGKLKEESMTAEKVEEILRSAYQELYSKNFWRARNLFRDVLQVDPNNKEALLGEVLADNFVCYFHELLEDPFFIGSEDYQRLIQHDALRPYQNDLNRHLEKLYQDAMERALHPEHFWDNYWDEDEEKFAHDFYMDQVYHKFVVLGDYKDAAQKAENFKEFHKVRNRYGGLCSYREYLYDKKNEWLSKKKKSDWCITYHLMWLIWLAVFCLCSAMGILDGGVGYIISFLAFFAVAVVFSALTWSKISKNSFWEGFFLVILFNIIIWMYLWIRSLPFIFSRKKYITELDKAKKELENCQKEIAELSAKVELYESKFDLR